MKRVILTKDQQEIYIDISEPSKMPSFFVFALYKSGSLMLDGILENICSELQIPLVSIAKSAFAQGFGEEMIGEEVCTIFSPIGYGYYGSRHVPSYLHNFDFSTFKKILLIRDPRDVLVSHYFSMKKSHAIPSGPLGAMLTQNRERLQEIDVNEYVVQQAPSFGNIIRNFSRLEQGSLKVFRYEDIVFHKKEWIQDILEYLNLSLEDSVIQKIVAKYDVFPTTEDPAAHIRKVTPGDYREKLNTKTIGFLNANLRDILIKYNYEIA